MPIVIAGQNWFDTITMWPYGPKTRCTQYTPYSDILQCKMLSILCIYFKIALTTHCTHSSGLLVSSCCLLVRRWLKWSTSSLFLSFVLFITRWATWNYCIKMDRILFQAVISRQIFPFINRHWTSYQFFFSSEPCIYRHKANLFENEFGIVYKVTSVSWC